MNPPAGYRRETPDGHPPHNAPAYVSTHKRAPRHAPIPLEHTLSEITGPRFERDQLAPGDDDLTHFDGGQALFAHEFVGFAMILAAFGVAEDHPGSTRIAQHPASDVAGMGTLLRLMTVLAADSDGGAFEGLGDDSNMQRGRANNQFRADALGTSRYGPRERDCLRGQAVHLPVPGNQLRHCFVHISVTGRC